MGRLVGLTIKEVKKGSATKTEPKTSNKKANEPKRAEKNKQ